MPNPFRSEAEAFIFAVGTATAAALSVVLVVYVSAPLGWAVFGILALVGLALAMRRRPARPRP